MRRSPEKRTVKISENVSVLVHIFRNRNAGTPLVFLHGYASSGKDFFDCARLMRGRDVYLIDLPGFGGSKCPARGKYFGAPYLMKMLDYVAAELEIQCFYLAGYSMGGRLAVSYAVKNSEKLKGLILESTSPGLKEKHERSDRLKSDIEFAKLVRKNGLKFFVDQWKSLPLFDSQKNLPPGKKVYRTIQLKNNNVDSLALSVIAFGQGNMQPVWKQLNGLKCPVLLICGKLDVRYCGIMNDMAKVIPFARKEVVKGAGHNVHLEKPDEFIKLLNTFLDD